MINFLLTTLPTTQQQRLQLIYFVLIALLLFFAMVGGIGYLFERLILNYGNQIDTDMWKMMETRVLTSPQEYRRIARIKNHRRTFTDFCWAVIVIGLDAIVLFGYMALFDDAALLGELFNYQTRGFTTLFPIFDWSNIPQSEFFGLMIISDFPTLLNTPRFVPEATISYIVFLISILGSLLLIKATLAFFGRTIRIQRDANTIFTKRLQDIAKKL